MDTWTSKELQLPIAAGQPDFTRADLVFEGVEHRNESYEARVFVNNRDADQNTPMDEANGFAGYFVIFGHGGCAGDAGHCDVPQDQTDPEDQRLAHPLTPATKLVIATEALRKLAKPRFRVTVVPVLPGKDGARRADVLEFAQMQLRTYD
jgi:hypothetical protein